jgi:capsular exopolysaccharide synthesis family protein
MRRPRIATILKLPPSFKGLSTFLTGQCDLKEVVVETGIPNLDAIPCGPIPPNPVELFSSPTMQDLLVGLRKQFEYVVLDSPPVLHVSDAQVLASQVDAAILVTHGGSTPREFVNAAKESLLRVKANVIGVVLNNVDFEAVGYEYYYRYYKGYGYGYGYGYGEKDRGDSVDRV